MQVVTIFWALVVCATLVWIAEADECDGATGRCGDKCVGRVNCKCGNQTITELYHQWCCPSSPVSCVEDTDGKTIFKTRQKKSIFSFF